VNGVTDRPADGTEQAVQRRINDVVNERTVSGEARVNLYRHAHVTARAGRVRAWRWRT